MFCIRCGKTLPPEALFCPHCGQKAVTAQDAPGETPPNRPAEPPAAPPKIDCGLSLAIIAVVLGNVIGIVALVYSVLATDRLKSGDYEGARRAARTGRIWSWSAIVFFAVVLGLACLILPSLVDLVMQGVTEI